MTSQRAIRRVSIGCALAISFLASAATRAGDGCDANVSRKLAELQRLSASVRVDKPGLARVYAQDGTDFTAGQALWIKGQLREAEAACARGDRAEAESRLDAVKRVVSARQPQNL